LSSESEIHYYTYDNYSNIFSKNFEHVTFSVEVLGEICMPMVIPIQILMADSLT